MHPLLFFFVFFFTVSLKGVSFEQANTYQAQIKQNCHASKKHSCVHVYCRATTETH